MPLRTDFVISDSLVSRFSDVVVQPWLFPCRPRVLVLTDGLNYRSTDGFGLTRFLEAITIHSAVTTKPVVTLAFRGVHFPASISIGPDTYNIQQNFNFATANPAVTLANYDQIWIFGIGAGAFGLSNAEVAVISKFMNGGGGVFATGDHAALGRQLSGGLPRIRHMREWAAIPMGTEVPSIAVNRIDTVVNPGANNLYEFEDQSDGIPQRIYPNYRVTGTTNTNWQATVHPLLMRPGAAATRSDNTGFTLDIDVLPDHPHESVCFATPPAVLNANYNQSGQNFVEYQPSVANPAQRTAAGIVAFAVSGGRSVFNGVWKPPVRPQMFGVISAYDGRLAQPYTGTTRPGRVVCDSTWHHFVNINLDGVTTSRTALGTGTGNAFVPGPQLLKIYAYYRNIVRWLQPANRIWCNIFWELTTLRYHALLIEELVELDKLTDWRDFVGIGRTATLLLTLAHGSEAADEMVTAALLTDPQYEAVGDLLANAKQQDTPFDTSELATGVLGALLVRLAQMLPVDDDEKARSVLEAGVEKNVPQLIRETQRSVTLGLDEQATNAERTLSVLKDRKLRTQ